jgi:hypothetical protein
VASFSNGWPIRTTSRAGVLSWARMISAAHSTIDIAEPARDIERAAAIFARSEGATFPLEAISNLRLAVVLLMAIQPHTTQYEAECAVIAEFMTRAERKLGQVRDAAGLLRAARTKLERELSIP